MNLFQSPPDVLVRALWALAIIAAGLAFYWAFNRLLLVRAQRNSAGADDRLRITSDGTPAILYFTTPDCAACKAIQKPALARIQERLGDRLQVIEVNALEQPELASRWGVLSVPTTFVIDPQGKLRYVNHGATRAEKLLQQVEEIIP